jgi:hypothetical protein
MGKLRIPMRVQIFYLDSTTQNRFYRAGHTEVWIYDKMLYFNGYDNVLRGMMLLPGVRFGSNTVKTLQQISMEKDSDGGNSDVEHPKRNKKSQEGTRKKKRSRGLR